jgi:hypothetical protein
MRIDVHPGQIAYLPPESAGDPFDGFEPIMMTPTTTPQYEVGWRGLTIATVTTTDQSRTLIEYIDPVLADLSADWVPASVDGGIIAAAAAAVRAQDRFDRTVTVEHDPDQDGRGWVGNALNGDLDDLRSGLSDPNAAPAAVEAAVRSVMPEQGWLDPDEVLIEVQAPC